MKYFGNEIRYKIKKNKHKKVITQWIIPLAVVFISVAIMGMVTLYTDSTLKEMEEKHNIHLQQLIHEQHKDIKEFEHNINIKMDNTRNTINAIKNIISALAELRIYMIYELESEVLNDLSTGKFFEDTPKPLNSFYTIYLKNIKIIEKESIFLPKELYLYTKRKISSISQIIDFHKFMFLMTKAENLGDGVFISLMSKENNIVIPKVNISKNLQNDIKQTVYDIQQEFEVEFHNIQNEYREIIKLKHK